MFNLQSFVHWPLLLHRRRATSSQQTLVKTVYLYWLAKLTLTPVPTKPTKAIFLHLTPPLIRRDDESFNIRTINAWSQAFSVLWYNTCLCCFATPASTIIAIIRLRANLEAELFRAFGFGPVGWTVFHLCNGDICPPAAWQRERNHVAHRFAGAAWMLRGLQSVSVLGEDGSGDASALALMWFCR